MTYPFVQDVERPQNLFDSLAHRCESPYLLTGDRSIPDLSPPPTIAHELHRCPKYPLVLAPRERRLPDSRPVRGKLQLRCRAEEHPHTGKCLRVAFLHPTLPPASHQTPIQSRRLLLPAMQLLTSQRRAQVQRRVRPTSLLPIQVWHHPRRPSRPQLPLPLPGPYPNPLCQSPARGQRPCLNCCQV